MAAAAAAGVNSYLSNHYEGMSPEQLIFLLFKGALDRLRLVKEGIEEKNIQKRGENLSKAIAIISELNASLNPEMDDESTNFLRGLYGAILAELPKVSITNDKEIIRRTEAYLTRLTEIWETDVMGKGKTKEKKIASPQLKPVRKPTKTAAGTYPPQGGKTAFHSFSV